jgi:hypothetical protein
VTRLHDVWLRERLEELAGDVGRLRLAAVGTDFEWRLSRIAGQLWALVAATRPTAADLVREGGDVDAALAAADQETARLRRLLGDAS